ncbi:hypothetical protein [Lactiplantibacillus plantarum]|uniref:hypothetical protein n=1 Tax=Lactiplantibacillus plantarum TaxID=1590 RepID=UPI001BA60550|nr:hypothetical protein [Lactiplantibacillus plantarum]MBS0935684.1 hypothetical protein [Lactiplantibacillus plantarum]MBS0943959.1 hypothetical protein [Lactiplantibacillus plantarum]
MNKEDVIAAIGSELPVLKQAGKLKRLSAVADLGAYYQVAWLMRPDGTGLEPLYDNQSYQLPVMAANEQLIEFPNAEVN